MSSLKQKQVYLHEKLNIKQITLAMRFARSGELWVLKDEAERELRLRGLI